MIYAGAIMVLFLFIVMMLEIKPDARNPGAVSAAMAPGPAPGGDFLAHHVLVDFAGIRQRPFLSLTAASPLDFGRFLFQKYWFAVEIASFLLFVALVGASTWGGSSAQGRLIMATIVPYSHVLILAAILFFLGAACAMARRNLVMILIGVEVMLNAAGLAFMVAGSCAGSSWTARPWSSSSWPWRPRKWRWAWP